MRSKVAAASIEPWRARGFDCLCGNARMAARALTTLYDRYLAPAGVTASQLAVLWCVIGAEPVAMRDVARHLVMDKTTVTRNVAAMVEAGLVAVRAGDDARMKALVATARGRRTFARAIPLWESAQSHVAERFGAAGFAEAVRQTRRLARVLRDGAQPRASVRRRPPGG